MLLLFFYLIWDSRSLPARFSDGIESYNRVKDKLRALLQIWQRLRNNRRNVFSCHLCLSGVSAQCDTEQSSLSPTLSMLLNVSTSLSLLGMRRASPDVLLSSSIQSGRWSIAMISTCHLWRPAESYQRRIERSTLSINLPWQLAIGQ
jgi:hypothetical protein